MTLENILLPNHTNTYLLSYFQTTYRIEAYPHPVNACLYLITHLKRTLWLIPQHTNKSAFLLYCIFIKRYTLKIKTPL